MSWPLHLTLLVLPVLVTSFTLDGGTMVPLAGPSPDTGTMLGWAMVHQGGDLYVGAPRDTGTGDHEQTEGTKLFEQGNIFIQVLCTNAQIFKLLLNVQRLDS